MKFLDTNIFVRFLAGDDLQKSEACLRLFRKIRRGEETATTSEANIAEVAYVLSSPALYHLDHGEISARLQPLLALPGLKVPHRRVYLHALDVYAAHTFLDFEDALAVAHMKRAGIEELVSYDTDFDRIPEVKRVEP